MKLIDADKLLETTPSEESYAYIVDLDINFSDYLLRAYTYVKENGYVKNSTGDKVMLDFSRGNNIKPASFGEVAAFINWLKEKRKGAKTGDYFASVYDICARKKFKVPYEFNTICSALNIYFKDLKRQEEKDASNFIGNVGEKVTLTVAERKLLSSRTYGYYGGSEYNFFRIVGTDGNIYTLGTSDYIEEGDEITATVKDHNEYKGEKQTVLTRGKIKHKAEQPKDAFTAKDSVLLSDIYSTE